MGAEISSGGEPDPQQINISRFLSVYESICDTYDESLGKLKIYRKKQYNFDYVAVVDKLVEKQYVEEMRGLMGLGDWRKGQGKLSKKKENKSESMSERDLWIKVYGFEVRSTENKDQNYQHVRICFEYLNFSLRDYLSNIPLSPQLNSIPYILCCIVGAFRMLQQMQREQPRTNIMPLISSITTPSLIHLDVEGCLKMIPIPIFMLTDYVTTVDKCVMNCCRFQVEGNYQYRNIVMPRFGRNKDKCLDGQILTTEKLFMSRVTKLIKHLKQAHLNTNNSHGPQQQIKTQPNNSRNIQKVPILKTYKSQIGQPGDAYPWYQLGKINNMEQLSHYLSQINDIPNCLKFVQDKKSKTSNNNKLDKFKLSGHELNNNIKNSINFTQPTGIGSSKMRNPNNESFAQVNTNFVTPSLDKRENQRYRVQFQYL